MTDLNSVIFVDSYPKLDLHGYDSETARVAIEDFIVDNIKMKNEIIVIVHGVGTGTIKKVTHDVLKNNKNIIEYKTYYNNTGVTITNLKV